MAPCSKLWKICSRRRFPATGLTFLINATTRPQTSQRAGSWTTRREVGALLAQLGLDQSAIEAEAYRLRVAEIESVDRLLTSKQRSLEDALRFIGKLRKNLGDRLRQSSAERLEENAPPIVVARFSRGE